MSTKNTNLGGGGGGGGGGDASIISILLGNHAKFGLAERTCYHFDLLETLTSIPLLVVSGHSQQNSNQQARLVRRRDRGQSISSQEGGCNNAVQQGGDASDVDIREEDEHGGDKSSSSQSLDNKSSSTPAAATAIPTKYCSSNSNQHHSCICGVVSLLECVPGGNSGAGVQQQQQDRASKRALRMKHREFNTLAQLAWGRGEGGSINTNGNKFCHQPLCLPLTLSPSTRVTFAYELTSIVILVDASPSLVSTCGMPWMMQIDDDEFGEKKSGTPSVIHDNCCVPLDRLGRLLKTYLVGLVQPIAVNPSVSISGMGVDLDYWKPNLAITVVAAYPPTVMGDRASAGLLVRDFRVTDETSAIELANQVELWALQEVENTISERLCRKNNEITHTTTPMVLSVLDSFSLPPQKKKRGTHSARSYMKEMLAVGDSALLTLPPEGRPMLLIATDCHNVNCGDVFELLSQFGRVDVPISVLDLSSSVISGNDNNDIGGFSLSTSNDTQSLRDITRMSGGIFLRSTLLDTYIATTVGFPSTPALQSDCHFDLKKRAIRTNTLQWFTLFSMSPLTPTTDVTTVCSESKERIIFSRYSIQPVRIKSVIMTRVVEGYRARRYGHDTQDINKVSIQFVLSLADCGVTIHYEITFLSSPYHIPTVGQAHIRIELSGDDSDFLRIVKMMFASNSGSDKVILQGRRISDQSKAAANRVCSILRWTRKEDYLESYLSMPGWGSINHFAPGSAFLSGLESMSTLQRYRHFRSEEFEIVMLGPCFYERITSMSIFGDVMDLNHGEDELYFALATWSTGFITERETYFRVISPAKDDDLAYYCIVRVNQSSKVSRLYTLTVYFHGELDTEVRIGVIGSLKEATERANTLVLQKCISSYITLRPANQTSQWSPCWNEHFIHHESWELLKTADVQYRYLLLLLISKRRHEIGGFFILNSNSTRVVFAKFIANEGDGREMVPSNLDLVIYQVLSRDDGIFVDIHMEASQSRFSPFNRERCDTQTSTSFSRIYEVVKSRDIDCAKNVLSRINLLAVLDNTTISTTMTIEERQARDVLRLIKLSTLTQHQLRFFISEGSGSANEYLRQLTSQYITSKSFQESAKLSIGKNTPILQYSGSWFILRVDWYILSIVCLENHDTTTQCKSTQPFRNLSFFTADVHDLYQSDDDIINDKVLVDKADGGSNHFDFTIIDSDHTKNFARACYRALRDTAAPIAILQNDDFEYALSSLYFEEILQIFFPIVDGTTTPHSSSSKQTATGVKLFNILGTLLRIVPGSDGTVFYYFGDEIDSVHPNNQGSPIVGESLDEFISAEHNNQDQLHAHGGGDDNSFGHVPLFFRIMLDGELVGMTQVLALKKSASLAVEVSCFQRSDLMLQNHTFVASKLHCHLNRFSSEQTLEKYRFMGSSLTVPIIKDVMLILPKTSHKSCKMELEVFVSKSNSFITVGVGMGGYSESDLLHGVNVLTKEFESVFTKVGRDLFLVLDDCASREVLPYWCILTINPRGITIQMYHPLGDDVADEQLQIIRRLVRDICDRANQLLMLETLYNTKQACDMLIGNEREEYADEEGKVGTIYRCPIKHRASIPLHRRCSPQQIVAELETQILQNFVVSNRRGIFVYKDELQNVFYMELKWSKVPGSEENDQNPHMIELIVRGCDEPGQLITSQLVFLLKKKVLELTLDSLSSLLNKNPWFNLLNTDLTFIKGFKSALRSLGKEEENLVLPTRTFILPPTVLDPLVILLMFRHNICGNTFFHELHTQNESSKSNIVEVVEDNEEVMIRFTTLPTFFQIYFNSSPSRLDPNYQTGNTLTEKGREYARKAGSGIAIVDVILKHGQSHCEMLVGKRGQSSTTNLRVHPSDICLSICEDDKDHIDQFRIQVKVINTTADLEVIHKWLELSLSQVVAAFCIERHIESSQLGLLHDAHNINKDCLERSKLESLNRVYPGLSALEDMMMIAHNMPHPVITRVEHRSMLRAINLADITLDLSESMINSLASKKKSSVVDILRYNPHRGYSVVTMRKDKTHGCARVELSTSGAVIRDKPTDCPEYIVVFGLNRESLKSNINTPMNLFFKQVFPQSDESSSFFQALSCVKVAKPSLFQRHLVLIIRISRSMRTLVTFNVNPDLRAKLDMKFNEINESMLKAEGQFRNGFQIRCMRHISLPTNDTSKQNVSTDPKQMDETKPQTELEIVIPKQVDDTKPQTEVETTMKRGQTRRIPRPTAMLRPTLIGKSIEGSAIQAVTANRLRASARPSIPQRQVSSNEQATPQQGTHALAKPAPLDHKVSSGSLKQRKNVTAKPHSSLLHAYQLFFSHMKEVSRSAISQHRLSQSFLQKFANHVFLSSDENRSSLLSTHLMCTCYANCLGAGFIQQLPCDDKIATAKAFVNFITHCWGMTRILPTAADNSSNSCFPQQIFLQKTLLSRSPRTAIILIEVSTFRDNSRGSFILGYKAWLVKTADTNISKTSRTLWSIRSMEKESATIEAVTKDFLGRLNLNVELFNYACLRACKVARGAKLRIGPSVLPLLRSTIKRFDVESQSQKLSSGYRLQRRFLSPSTFLKRILLDSCSKAMLVDYFRDKFEVYNLTCNGSGNDICFIGKISIAGFVVYYFMGWHELVESALDVFALCVTKGRYVDGFITKEGSPYAEKILDVVLHSVMTHVQELVESASKAIHKIQLWESFGRGLVFADALIDGIAELRAISHHLDLVSIDPRLKDLLWDESNELRVSWKRVLMDMTQSPSFSNCTTVITEDTSSTYLVNFKEEDMFVEFILDQHENIQEARILTRGGTEEVITVKIVVEKITTFVLSLIWCDSENRLISYTVHT